MPQTWMITGANRGIGLAITIELLRRGDRVVAAARNPWGGALAELAAEHPAALIPVELDVTSDASVAAAKEALAGQPIIGTSECELIGQAAAFDRVQATPERLLLVFHPVADGSEHRLELRRDGERLTGEYVAEANDIRRAVIAERAPDDAR